MPQRSERTSESYGWRDALHDTVYRSSMPVKAIAEELGVSPSYLRNACDGEQPDAHLSARHLPALMRVADNLAVLDYLAKKAGCVAVRVPSGSGAEHHALGRLARETGDVLTIVADALADERLGADELRRIDKEIDDVLKAEAALKQCVHCMASASGTHHAAETSRAEGNGTALGRDGATDHGWSRAACVPPGSSQH